VFVVCLLLASFLIVQADLPVLRAAAERAGVIGATCASHECCCSTESHRMGECCCESEKEPASGVAWRAPSCLDRQLPGDAPIVVKFQVVLPILATVQSWLPDRVVVFLSSDRLAPRIAEPPDPPPKPALAPPVAV
jgi:hypothetical protein